MLTRFDASGLCAAVAPPSSSLSSKVSLLRLDLELSTWAGVPSSTKVLTTSSKALLVEAAEDVVAVVVTRVLASGAAAAVTAAVSPSSAVVVPLEAVP